MSEKGNARSITKVFVCLLVGLAGAFLCWRFVPQTDLAITLLVGVLVAVFTELTFLLCDLTRHSASLSSLDSILKSGLNHREIKNTFGRFVMGLQFQSIVSPNGLYVHSHGFRANPRMAELVWRELPQHVDSSLVISSYCHPDEWREDYVRWAVRAEKRLLEDEKRVSRIFLWNNAKEAQRIQLLMKTMQDAGIITTEANRAKARAISGIHEHQKELGTWDFAIIDDQWVILSQLNKKRKTMFVEITNLDSKLQASKHVLHLLHSIGNT